MTAVGFALSAQQERLWTLRPEGPSGRAHAVVELTGALEPEALREAIEAVVGRHEILRTTFTRTPAARLPLQVVNDAPDWHWQTVEPAGPAEGSSIELAEFAAPGGADWGLGATLVRRGPERHLLVLSAPAVVCDSRGLELVAAEALEALAGAAFAEDPLQYADYAAWQEEMRDDGDLDAAGHWAALTGEDGSITELPLIPAGAAAGNAVMALDVDPAAVAALARAAEAEVEDAWLAVWAVAVARLSGAERPVLAARIDGRSQDELAGAIGPYLRTLPLACSLSPGTSLGQAVRAVAEARTAATSLQDAAPASLAASASSASRVGFAFHELPRLEAPAGLEATVVEAGDPADTEPVTLICSPRGARLVFDGEIAAQAGHVARVVERVAADLPAGAATDIWELEVLTDPERAQLLDELSQGPPALERQPVPWTVEDLAARTPAAPALACGDHELDYGQLNARANRVAHALRARGVTRDTPVAICMDRSVELVVGILGILKAGGAYVPLHPEHPRSRLDYQLGDSSAGLVLTRTSLLPLLEGLPAEPILLDGDGLAGEADTDPERINEPDDLAYLIYTSGSTGLPKAVGVRHAGLSAYAAALGAELGLEPSRPLRFGLVTSVSTDLGNTSLFGALTSGGCLELVPVETALDGRAFAEHVAARPLDVLKITPSHLAGLLAGGDDRVLPSAHLVVGGEALSWELADRVLAARRCSVTNHYGPTETTVGSLTHRVGADPTGRALARTVPIGRPIAGAEVYVLDARLAPVPLGAPGELCIGGAGLARGYWGNEEETVARFVPHPFSSDPVARLYRTGDLVRYLPDGEIEFLGRIDEQVKLRGYRVEPGEVDHVLGRHPGVARAATVVRSDGAGEPRLVAYIVADDDAPASAAELRAHAQEHLPDHMVPSAIVLVAALPLTPGGKLDRAALPAPEAATGSEPLSPRDDNERQVAEIWEQLLGLEQVGVLDNFFELGGHSLLATQVIARIRSAFDVQLPLHSLFTSPTVAELTVAVVEAQAASAPGDDPDLVALLDEIENMSDEEAQQLLDAARGDVSD